MAVIYAVMAALAAFVALGFAYRVSVVALFLIFTCVELIDVTNYLNHYYLVGLLLLLMSFLPLHRTWSLDARICPARASQTDASRLDRCSTCCVSKAGWSTSRRGLRNSSLIGSSMRSLWASGWRRAPRRC